MTIAGKRCDCGACAEVTRRNTKNGSRKAISTVEDGKLRSSAKRTVGDCQVICAAAAVSTQRTSAPVRKHIFCSGSSIERDIAAPSIKHRHTSRLVIHAETVTVQRCSARREDRRAWGVPLPPRNRRVAMSVRNCYAGQLSRNSAPLRGILRAPPHVRRTETRIEWTFSRCGSFKAVF